MSAGLLNYILFNLDFRQNFYEYLEKNNVSFNFHKIRNGYIKKNNTIQHLVYLHIYSIWHIIAPHRNYNRISLDLLIINLLIDLLSMAIIIFINPYKVRTNRYLYLKKNIWQLWPYLYIFYKVFYAYKKTHLNTCNRYIDNYFWMHIYL